MLIVDRLQQLITVTLVIGSAILLAIAQQQTELGLIAVTAAVAAFVFNDWLGWLTFNRLIANVAAICVTGYTLRNFLQADSTSQLFMIANLLVYLQIVLMFQRKTPRVYWQILVLSLLQVVVAAAFNISFEGGIVFLAYILLSSAMMLILQVHTQTTRIRNANRRTADAIREIGTASNPPSPVVLTMFDQVSPERRLLGRMVRQVLGLGVVAIGFAAVAFFLLPRDQETWSGAPLVQFQVAGASRSINLDERNDIYLSDQPVFEAGFDRAGKYIQLPEEPYFHGIPLPNLVIRNGQTSWEAPFDRVYGGSGPLPGLRTSSYLIQTIHLEPTSDPMLFSVMPATTTSRSVMEVEWSHQLGVLSRSGDLQAMSGSSFSYDLRVAVRDRASNALFRATPYTGINRQARVPLTEHPGEYKWLTRILPERYPNLVQIAQQTKSLVPDPSNHYELANAMCNYFLYDGGFSYTLEFSGIRWNSQLDRLEDFVANQKRGHCELYASALAIMLRSVGIPARVVVGYRGGSFDGSSNLYKVRQLDAHAWVEAYIPPEDCPRDWRRTGETDRLGSWLRLDPTPASDEIAEARESNLALTAAKNFWNNYVMGLDSDKQRDSLLGTLISQPLRGWGAIFTWSYWKYQWQLLTDPNTWYSSAFVKLLGLLALVIGLYQLQHWWLRRQAQQADGQTRSRTVSLQRWLGRALAVVAPRLGRWVAGESENQVQVPFFQRLLRQMHRIGLDRQPQETAREFAQQAGVRLSNHARALDIQPHIEKIVDYFYRVRFRGDPLSSAETQEVEASLNFLETELAHWSPA